MKEPRTIPRITSLAAEHLLKEGQRKRQQADEIVKELHALLQEDGDPLGSACGDAVYCDYSFDNLLSNLDITTNSTHVETRPHAEDELKYTAANGWQK